MSLKIYSCIVLVYKRNKNILTKLVIFCLSSLRYMYLCFKTFSFFSFSIPLIVVILKKTHQGMQVLNTYLFFFLVDQGKMIIIFNIFILEISKTQYIYFVFPFRIILVFFSYVLYVILTFSDVMFNYLSFHFSC